MNQHTHTYTHTLVKWLAVSNCLWFSPCCWPGHTAPVPSPLSFYLRTSWECCKTIRERGSFKEMTLSTIVQLLSIRTQEKKTFMRLKKIKSGVSERIWKKWEKKKYHDSVGFLTSWQESFHPDSPAALTWCTCSSNDNTEKAFKNGSKISSCLVSGEDTQTSYALRRKVLRDAFWESMFVAKVKSSSVQIWENTCAYMDGVKTEWSDCAAGVRQLLYTIYHTHTHTHTWKYSFTHTPKHPCLKLNIVML